MTLDGREGFPHPQLPVCDAAFGEAATGAAVGVGDLGEYWALVCRRSSGGGIVDRGVRAKRPIHVYRIHRDDVADWRGTWHAAAASRAQRSDRSRAARLPELRKISDQ